MTITRAEEQPSRLKTFLAAPGVVAFAVGVAVLLNLPSVGGGWHLDDLVHRAHFLEVGPMMDSSNMTHRMFDFLSGRTEDIWAHKDLGVLPWWTEDNLKIRFWRPLSSFTHVIDYTLWPNSGALMHLHSIAWLAILVASVASLYRRMIDVPFVAGLATILYALDDAHGFPVGFLANRNAIIATSFGALSLVFHDRARREGFRPGTIVSPMAFAAALLAGESGIGAAPYLLGYALFVARGPLVHRLATILPHGAVGIAWLAFYKFRGFGAVGSEFYLDPVGQPIEWLSAFGIRAPLLFLGQWFVPPSSFAFVWSPSQALGIAAFGVLFAMALFFLLRPILKESAASRFFAFGMVVSLIPITAGFPHDRLLFFVGLGAMALLAMLLVRLFDRSVSPPGGRLIGFALVIVHVVIAAPLQSLTTTAVASQEPLYAGPARSLPDDPKLESQRLIVVNPPSFFYGQYNLLVPRFDSKPAPQNMLMLAPGMSRLSIHRLSANALAIEAQDGWLTSPFDNVFRSRSKPVPENYRVELSGVQIDVIARTEDGRPQRVRFIFGHSLEDDAYRWVRQEDGRFHPFVLPEPGQVVNLDPIPFNLLSPPTE